MKGHFLIQDLKNSRLASLILSLLILITSLLIASSMILSHHLYQSINNMAELAQTPDLLFMHTGDIDERAIDQFGQKMIQEGLADHYQVLPFLNLDNHQLNFGPLSMENNSQDNGFSIQGKSFDYLLGQDNQIIQVAPGEIYLPLHFYHPDLKIGQQVEVADLSLVFKGYLRDSQMNSPLASSKRFLVAPEDLAQLNKHGNLEYLIEFKSPDEQKIKDIERRYLDAGLPANGPTITSPLFRLMNALSDGMIIFVILFASCLVLLVAYLALSYTVKENLNQDFQSLAIMKAIGLRNNDLRDLFQVKYLFISIVSSLLGIIISPIITSPIKDNIRRYMGQVTTSLILSIIFYSLTFILINGIIYLFIRHQLKQFQKIKPIMGLRQTSLDLKSLHPQSLIQRNKFKSVSPNFLLAIQNIRSSAKPFLKQGIILILVLSIMVIPRRLTTTIADPKFAQQLGLGDYHLLVSNTDIQQNSKVLEFLKRNEQVKAFDSLSFAKFKVINRDNTYLLTQMGDHSIFPIQYSHGSYPSNEHQIALSHLLANDLGFKIGDHLDLQIGDQIEHLEVVGIYSDITNGGKSAKITQRPQVKHLIKTSFGLQLQKPEQVQEFMEQINQNLIFVRVNDIKSQMDQMYGSIQNGLKRLANISLIIGCGLIILITYLTLHMILIRDKNTINTMYQMGFRTSDMVQQQLNYYYLQNLGAIIFGMILIDTLGQVPARIFLSSMGSQGLVLKALPIFQYLVIPGILFSITTVIVHKLINHHFDSIRQQGGH